MTEQLAPTDENNALAVANAPGIPATNVSPAVAPALAVSLPVVEVPVADIDSAQTAVDTVVTTPRANPRAFAGSWAVKGLFLLALIASLKVARELLLPVVTALILSLVFLPVVRGMRKLFIPAPVAGAIIVIGVFALLSTGVYNLAAPAGDWLAKAPQSLKEIGGKLRKVAGSVHDVATATAQVQSMTQAMATGTPDKVQEVAVQGPSMAGTVLGAAQEFSVHAARTFVLLYFLLASGNIF